MEVELEPGQPVQGELTASKGVPTVEVVYEMSLSGNCALNYGKKYKDPHFWTFDINEVMEAGGLPATITPMETMQVGFYADSKVSLEQPTAATA